MRKQKSKTETKTKELPNELQMPPRRLFCVEATRWEGDLGLAVVLVERDSDFALAEFHRLYPELTRRGTCGRVYPADFAEIDFETGRSFVIRRKYRAPRIVSLTDGDKRDNPE